MLPSRHMEEKLKQIIREKVFVTKEQKKIAYWDGSESPWLFDFRNIFLVPEYIDLIVEIFWEKLESRYPFQVCGLEAAAIPLVTAIVMKSVEKGKPVNGFFIRKSRKKTGLMQMIEGEINNHPIIIVDDVLNSGNSVMRQIKVLEELDKNVSEVFVILQFRERDYYEFLKERGVALNNLFVLPDFSLPFQKNNGKKFLGDAFRVEWYFKSENSNFFHVNPKSTPALDAERIYFGSDGGYFWALNQSDGTVAWKYKVGFHPKGKSIFSSPAVCDEIVYFGAYDGNAYALDAKTGKKRWMFMEADWVGSSPAIAPDLGLLFIGLEFGLFKKQGGIVALDLATGKKKWEHITEAYTHGSPAYSKSKGVVAIGSNDSTLYLYSARNGKLLWSLKTRGEIKASPIFDEKRNLVLFGNFEGKLYALDISTGKERWVFPTEFGIYSTPTFYKNSVFIGSMDKRVYSINLDTGGANWTFETSGRIFASPAIVEEKLYIGSNDGRLYELNPDTGEITGFIQITERIVNKVVYNKATKRFFLPTFANEIYCLTKK